MRKCPTEQYECDPDIPEKRSSQQDKGDQDIPEQSSIDRDEQDQDVKIKQDKRASETKMFHINI